MMKMKNAAEFISSIGGFGVCKLDLSSYVYHNYECACGQTHTFDYDSEVLCQGAWKLVVGCPSKEYVTCLKLKSKFLGMGFSGFESLFGTKSDPDPENENSAVVLRYVIYKHIGRV